MTIPVRHVDWNPCFRIIPTKYPEERVFDRVTDPDDRDAIDALEGMTNERVRARRGEISLVAPGDEARGPGSEYIMAAFAYPNPEGSRFTDGSYGVYYATRELETAIAETKYHRERFMRRTKEPPMWLPMRVLEAHLRGDLHDIRGRQRAMAKVYSKTSYAASRDLARKLIGEGADGIAFDSVRRPGGECAAVFKPRLLSACRRGARLVYEWDGESISKVFEVKGLHGL